MSFEIGSQYDSFRNSLVERLKKKEIEVVPVHENMRGYICYFCLEKIDGGHGEVLLLNDKKSEDLVFLHSRCYGASLLDEMDSSMSV